MSNLTPRINNIESFSNLIINGNLDFWQRGISFGTGAYTADRFKNTVQGGSSGTVTQSTDVPTFAESGFSSQHSLLYTVTSGAAIGAAQVAILEHKLEGYDYQIIHGNIARFRIWVKSSIAGTYGVSFRNASQNRSYVTPIVINAANVWENKVIDLTMDSSGTWGFTNGVGLHISIAMSSGSTFNTSTLNEWQSGNYTGVTGQVDLTATTSATFQIAQVSLTPGSSSGTFKRAGKTIQQELAMCQRYYEKSYEITTNPATSTSEGLAKCMAVSTTLGYAINSQFCVIKRTLPTISVLSRTGTSNTLTNEQNTADSGTTVSSPTGGERDIQAFSLVGATDTVVYRFHYLADAEL